MFAESALGRFLFLIYRDMKIMSFISKLVVAVSVSCCGFVQASDIGEYSKVVSVGGEGVTIRDVENNWFYGLNYSLSETDDDYSGSKTEHDLTVIIGQRFYFSDDEIRTFIDGGLSVSHELSDNDARSYRIFTDYGIETFISKAVSIGGSVGLRLSHYDSKGYDNTRLSGPNGKLFMSYYFN